MKQREMVEVLRTAYSVRQICEVLGFTRSNLYYHVKQDPSESRLRDEIETLALRYPTYGYRRITKLLLRQGYSVGYTEPFSFRFFGRFFSQSLILFG